MALQKQDGKYITVEDVKENGVTIRVHKDSNHRKRFKDGAEDEFESTKQETVNVEVNLGVVPFEGTTIKESLVTAGYLALKTNEEYTSDEDV